MKNTYASIDFEFTDIAEPNLRLVCCSIKVDDSTYEYWLLNNEDEKKRLIEDLEYFNSIGFIFLAHAVSAEASSFVSLGLNPRDFKWVDTFAEYRLLSNHWNEIRYGKHLIKGVEKKLVPPKPKWQQTEEDKKREGGKIYHSLAEAVYKFLDIKIDTQHKDAIRQIIIRGDERIIEKNKQAIMDYCTSDVVHLLPLLQAMTSHYKHLKVEHQKTVLPDMLWRGRTMANVAVMERDGYPIAYSNLKNFAMQIPDIMNECAEDINEQFPGIGIFEYKKATGTYTKKEKPIRDWISSSPYGDKWLKTDKAKFSLSLDAFGEHFSFRHDYPRHNFGAQMLRFLKLKQSLNGFSPKKKGKTFWHAVGSDKRVRSYLNPYGSQSARYQPPSTTFLFLKPGWMRSLCMPEKGKMIVGTDYKSEEFLISALVSGDDKMLKAYMSGDVYLAFGKDIGMIPKDGTKKTHPLERQICKAIVLAISYNMTKHGLSDDLTQKLGREVSHAEAQGYIDDFNRNFRVFHSYKQNYLREFRKSFYDRLPDGWIMFGDNENDRSVGNYPIQGFGSCILRKAIDLCYDHGLKPVVPLHDALYIECDLNDWDAVATFNKCMIDAFTFFFEGDRKKNAEAIMLDTEAWGSELIEGERVVDGVEVKLESVHIDERSVGELERFKRYFTAPDWSIL